MTDQKVISMLTDNNRQSVRHRKKAASNKRGEEVSEWRVFVSTLPVVLLQIWVKRRTHQQLGEFDVSRQGMNRHSVPGYVLIIQCTIQIVYMNAGQEILHCSFYFLISDLFIFYFFKEENSEILLFLNLWRT